MDDEEEEEEEEEEGKDVFLSRPGHNRDVSPSPIRSVRSSPMEGGRAEGPANLGAAQLRELREAFQVLDRDSDGIVNRDDVADVLANVGK